MSTHATIQTDIYNLFDSCINDNLSSDSSDSTSTINVVESFTVEDIEEKQVAISIANMANLQHNGVNDYQITVNISGQTYLQNDADKNQIKQLFGEVMPKIQNLTLSSIESYINNCVGYLIDGSNFDSDGENNFFTITVRLFVCDLN